MTGIHLLGGTELAKNCLDLGFVLCGRVCLPSGVTIKHVIAELLDALAHTPRLRGAACVGRSGLFDVADRDDPRVEAAKAICMSCPCLNRCRRWLRSQPVRGGRRSLLPATHAAARARTTTTVQPGPCR